MVRRSQQDRNEVRKASRDTDAALNSSQGTYRPDRADCRQRQWDVPYDDANTVRLQFIMWNRGKVLVDFVVNVQVLASEGWDTVEYFDCCHGHSHLHTQNSELDPRSVAQLDTADDVQHAFAQVEREADSRARIIRDERG